MQQLQLEKNRFYRIKRGQISSDVEKIFLCPVKENFQGAIVCMEACTAYSVKPFESYKTIAEEYGTDEERLKAFNFGRLLYPTRIIYIPN